MTSELKKTWGSNHSEEGTLILKEYFRAGANYTPTYTREELIKIIKRYRTAVSNPLETLQRD